MTLLPRHLYTLLVLMNLGRHKAILTSTAKLLWDIHSRSVSLMMTHIEAHLRALHHFLAFLLDSFFFLVASLALVFGVFLGQWRPSVTSLASEFAVIAPCTIKHSIVLKLIELELRSLMMAIRNNVYLMRWILLHCKKVHFFHAHVTITMMSGLHCLVLALSIWTSLVIPSNSILASLESFIWEVTRCQPRLLTLRKVCIGSFMEHLPIWATFCIFPLMVLATLPASFHAFRSRLERMACSLSRPSLSRQLAHVSIRMHSFDRVEGWNELVASLVATVKECLLTTRQSFTIDCPLFRVKFKKAGKRFALIADGSVVTNGALGCLGNYKIHHVAFRTCHLDRLRFWHRTLVNFLYRGFRVNRLFLDLNRGMIFA